MEKIFSENDGANYLVGINEICSRNLLVHKIMLRYFPNFITMAENYKDREYQRKLKNI